MALTSSSFQDSPQPPRNPAADSDALANSLDGVRMDRMGNVSAVAAAHTTGSAGESAIGAAFIGEDYKWTKTAGKRDAGSVPGTPGFPGDTNWPVG